MTATKILVTGDVLHNIKLLKAKLMKEYYTVIVAHDYNEAIDLISTQQPDIVLFDIMKPKISAFKICENLKSDTLTAHIPIIIIAGLHNPHYMVHSINSGADDFLTKPIDVTTLSAKIKSLTQLKVLMDELRLIWETNAEISSVIQSNIIMDYSNQIFNANILVVNEDNFHAKRIYKILGQFFKSIRILNDPSKALKIVIEGNYDIIISNMQFSQTDGLRLCSELRSRIKTRYIPILIISKNYDKNHLVKALNIGANDYLAIDIDDYELTARVSLQIKRKRYQDCLRKNLFDNAEMSIKDPLTNCYNRRYVDIKLRNFVKDSVEKNKKLSLMILDIDYFKVVNDNFGHSAGDSILKQMQKRISNNIRVTDLLARIGGEEFLVIMPCTNISNAYVIAEKIRKIISKEPFMLSDNNNITHSITVSIGIAEMQKHDINDIRKFMIRADRYLYKAKNSGRNIVVTD